jgi:hypothetical protein
MADTRFQRAVERWVCETWMPAQFGLSFVPRSLKLRSGGVFDFDAVSFDERIVANISTSSAKIASGGHGVGKTTKIRSDMLFLLMVNAPRRIVVFTERDMYSWWLGEVGRGRVPPEIEFAHAVLPEAMAAELTASKARASAEVRAR